MRNIIITSSISILLTLVFSGCSGASTTPFTKQDFFPKKGEKANYGFTFGGLIDSSFSTQENIAFSINYAAKEFKKQGIKNFTMSFSNAPSDINTFDKLIKYCYPAHDLNKFNYNDFNTKSTSLETSCSIESEDNSVNFMFNGTSEEFINITKYTWSVEEVLSNKYLNKVLKNMVNRVPSEIKVGVNKKDQGLVMRKLVTKK
ncbi:MAG: hypothetical protein K8R44_03615 [Sulfurimonas sp.]|nr:hypothetical protein [Sulfurimonas sp.]